MTVEDLLYESTLPYIYGAFALFLDLQRYSSCSLYLQVFTISAFVLHGRHKDEYMIFGELFPLFRFSPF